MPTQLQSRNDNFYVLRLNPVSELKACGASLLSGGLASTSSELLMSFAKAAIGIGTGSNILLAGFAFTCAAYPVYEAMERRAMQHGQWRIQTMKKPKISL